MNKSTIKNAPNPTSSGSGEGKHDLIDRQAAIDTAIEAADKWDGGYSSEREGIIRKFFDKVPAVQPTCKPMYADVSDTISRQAAIDALHMHLMYRMGTDSNKKRLDDWINGVPSAQPEIIRCRDCRYFLRDTEYGYDWCNRMSGVFRMKPDDFCSKAERRTDG